MHRDLIRRAVAPAAKISQCLQEPWLTRAALDDWQARLLGLASVVRTWREMLRVTILLRQWVSSRQVDLLVKACFYASPVDFFLGEDHMTRPATVWGRGLPAFMQTFHAMATQEAATFNGLELQRTQLSTDRDKSCLGPHCQCAFRPVRASSNSRRASVTMGRGRTRVKVPLWVGCSSLGAVQPHCTDDRVQPHKRYAPAPLRFHYCAEVVADSSVMGSKSRAPWMLRFENMRIV